jgi:hypothetical protein
MPLMERNEYIKARKRETAEEFFAFVKERQVVVAELDLEVASSGGGHSGGGGQKAANKGAAGSGTGGSSSGQNQKQKQ